MRRSRLQPVTEVDVVAARFTRAFDYRDPRFAACPEWMNVASRHFGVCFVFGDW